MSGGMVREKQRMFLKCEPLPPETEHKCAEIVAWLARDEDDKRLLAEALALGETAVCQECGAVYFTKDGHSCR